MSIMVAGEWVDKQSGVYLYNGILHSKKNENLAFAATQMDLESIMLSEINQSKTNIVCYHLYVESKKY